MTIDGNDMKSDSGFVSESPFILYVANGFVWGGFVHRAGVRCSERTVTIPHLCTCLLYTSAPGHEALESEFMAFAKEKGMVGIKGHRSVGGFRASIYNACPLESVEALVACMQEFEKMHK